MLLILLFILYPFDFIHILVINPDFQQQAGGHGCHASLLFLTFFVIHKRNRDFQLKPQRVA